MHDFGWRICRERLNFYTCFIPESLFFRGQNINFRNAPLTVMPFALKTGVFRSESPPSSSAKIVLETQIAHL